jgi:ferrous iron transport protein B
LSTRLEAGRSTLVVALAGNPNSGKTSLFNALTGLRRKVGNYPGVTVERVVGTTKLPGGVVATVLDLPGCYSLLARAEDERIARDVLLGLQPGTARPDAVVAVVDASNLERNLYFATQLFETGLRACVALNMVDVAKRAGTPVDAAALQRALGVPVVPVEGHRGTNVDALKAAILEARPAPRLLRLPPEAERAHAELRAAVERAGIVPSEAVDGETTRLLAYARDDDPFLRRGGVELRAAVAEARARLEAAGLDRRSIEAESRYRLCAERAARARGPAPAPLPSLSERIDRIVTHRLLGPVLYLALMAVIFLSVYSWAEPLMGLIEDAMGWLGGAVAALLGPGMLTDLLVDGVIAGVGNVIVFLPQICILFLFLGLLEDIGYLARAAFLVDRVMRAVGLNGKAFIPLLSSFACAIPGIMATRTIEDRRDRLVTILVAPLMSCSARLPVYALLIGAFVPDGWQSLTLLGMYVFSVTAAFLAAFALRKTLFRGTVSTFLLELPRYTAPRLRHVGLAVLSRAGVFVRQAGTVILAISIVLWFFAYFPRSEEIEARARARIEAGEEEEVVRRDAAAEQIRQSVAGRAGRLLEPAIEPLGFDWKIGIGLLSSFAAREVLVSSMGIIYGLGDVDEPTLELQERLRRDRRPDGRPAFTLLTAISLMVFFVLACQCMSTLAVVKRETNSWRWPLFMFAYMSALAYLGSLAVYQVGTALGWGS